MFGWVYDGASHHCCDCGWDGSGWELEGCKCPKCKGERVEELEY